MRPAIANPKTATMLLCQVSDPHITASNRLAYGLVDTATMLARCVERIQALPKLPDAVLITGDLVDQGNAEEYARLRDIIRPLEMPVYVLPGNHDEREAMRAAFSDHVYLDQAKRFLQYAIELGPLRLIALDTVVPREGRGELCSERLDWLEAQLAADSQRPTIVALHHPPFETGIAYMDRLGLSGSAELEAIVARHRQVERVLAGHLHRSIAVRFAHTVASTCPSPAHQVELNLEPGQPGQFNLEPPGFQLHWWSGSRLVTHTVPIGRFEGPFPFRRVR